MADETYSLTPADVAGMRAILTDLEQLDRQVGGYDVGSIQGHTQSATATVHFQKKAGAMATAKAIDVQLQAGPMLALLCKKVIADYETRQADQ